jgi:hypothetical protein
VRERHLHVEEAELIARPDNREPEADRESRASEYGTPADGSVSSHPEKQQRENEDCDAGHRTSLVTALMPVILSRSCGICR